MGIFLAIFYGPGGIGGGGGITKTQKGKKSVPEGNKIREVFFFPYSPFINSYIPSGFSLLFVSGVIFFLETGDERKGPLYFIFPPGTDFFPF